MVVCVLAAGALLFGPGSGADAWAAEGDPSQVISLSVDAERVTEGAVAGITLARSGDIAEELNLTAHVIETGAMLASPAETPEGEPIIRNLRFSASSTTVTLQEATVDDATDEPASRITFCPDTAGRDIYRIEPPVCVSVTVLDNDGESALSVADAEADEDDADDQANATMHFVVSLDASASGEVTVDYATSDGTAVAVADYEAASGTLTFAAGTVERTIGVSLVDDSLDELPETLGLTLSDPVGATIDDGVATGTINDDDPEPELRSSGVGWFFGSMWIGEGEDANVEMWLSEPSGRPVTVDYATAPGTVSWEANEAEVGSDYTHVAGTLTVEAGERSKTITVATNDDAVYEGTEGFSVKFSNPQGATLYQRPGVLILGPPAMYIDIYMVDDEPIPSVTLGDAADVESAGELSFPVTLTGPVEASMTYSTADGTAVAGEDYTAAADATLSFGPGVTSNTIRIAVHDDDVVEAATETFSVHLRQTLMRLSISVGNLEATGTIRDDDGAARLFIGDASASEGDGTLSFRVTLGGQSSGSVTVDYATAGATATAGRDYTETSGTLTFASGDIRRTITVPLLDDDKHETAETFSVSLSGAVGATLDDGTGTGTIHDDDESPLMTIHGSEGPETGLLDFVVTLSTAGGVAASVDYVTDQGFPAHDPPAFSLAEAGSDYTHQEGTFTFAPGEISKTIRVRVLEDLVDEPTEAIVITLENPINVQFELRDGSDTCPWSGCNYTACCDCGTILDDDVAGLSIGDASGPEDASHLEFEVSLGAQTENSVTVSYATSDATAMAVADYEAASGSLTFQAGTVLRTIQVSPVDDDRAEPTETFVVELSAPVGATITDAEGTGTITDDDDPAFSVTGGTGVEGDVVAFSVTLAGPGSRSATVSYATSDGTAVAVDDYVAASGTLTFAPGDSSKTVSVSLVDDDRAEPAETFALTLSSATNATIDTATADGTITDNDDPPEVSIGDAEGAEGEAVAFEVTLGEASGREVTVAFGTSDGTATGGEDYQTVAGILTFAPGDLARTVSVDLKLDGKDEPDETFTVTLSSASNATLGTAAGTGTIEDADEPPTLSVDAASGVEGSTAGFSVILDAASDFEVEVDYATSDGTAVVGEDYEAASGTLTFAPGEKARTVSVPLSDDVEDEPAETFLLRLSMRNATGAVAVVVTGTIVDNDDPPAFSVAGGAGAEGDAVEFSVTLAGSSSRSATVSYATSDGTAVAVDDYVAASGTLTFAPGESGRTVSVSLVDDDRDEPTETFAMTLSSPMNATMDTATADGTVVDNDGATQLSIIGAAGGEGGVLDFVVTLAGSSEETVTVSYGTRDGTAVAGEDYQASEGVLTFAPGESNRTLSVSLVDDAVHEPTETFTVTLSSAENADIALASAVGRIADDDGLPTLSVVVGAGREGAVAEFVVTLAGSGSEPVTVGYATMDGTAVAGEDYLATEGALTLAPDGAPMTVSVTLLTDGVDEPDETFVLQLRSPTNATLAVGDARGTIEDIDELPSLSVAAGEGVEGGTAEFAVTLVGSTSRPVSAAYATSDGSALSGIDYGPVRGVLTFAPGESRRTVPVALVDDSNGEPDETFTLALSSVRNAVVAVSSATGTIIDDDETALSIVGGTDIEGGAVGFVVTLTGSSDRAVTVSYATSDGTAVAADDYEAASGTLTFEPDESSRTVSVPLVDDDRDEPTETFAMTLSSAANAIIRAANANGTIIDNDDAPQLSIRGGSGGEGDVLAFVVVLAGSSEQTMTVSYATTDGTAVAGEDYEGASGTLTFAPGESSRTVSVSLLDDAVYEREENFRLELSSPANATLGTSTATGTIVDDDRAAKAPTKGRVLLFEPSANPDRQGFVRIINHSAEAGEILVEAVDDSGMRVGPVTLAIGAGAATHFNSDDLEAGNARKGLPDGVGPPSAGIWRLELSSLLDIEVLSYARTSDGFVTSLHDTAPATAGVHRVVFLNPGRNVGQVGRLRLINPGTEDAFVTIAGTDDGGGVSTEVVVDVPAGTAREWTAAELESGSGTDGALGDGEGKWRLRISSGSPVVAMSLIESPTGNLTNLSTLPRTPGLAEGTYMVPLLPSASDTSGRQGFVRVVNHSGEAAEVRIGAFDDTVWEYEPVTLAVGADEVASFNSDDLEHGNEAKGLTGSTGAGEGDWWLELSSDAEIEVLSYIRTTDGFLTSMHDLVPQENGEHRVVFFNPAKNFNQVSVLRLVNTGDADAVATITGVDDEGAMPGTAVRVAVPAGSSRKLTSAELESGEADAIDSGALGDGDGKWRLRVASDRPIMVVSLLENPTGHLTNLSTAPGRGAKP